jgi:hypothetical protein
MSRSRNHQSQSHSDPFIRSWSLFKVTIFTILNKFKSYIVGHKKNYNYLLPNSFRTSIDLTSTGSTKNCNLPSKPPHPLSPIARYTASTIEVIAEGIGGHTEQMRPLFAISFRHSSIREQRFSGLKLSSSASGLYSKKSASG